MAPAEASSPRERDPKVSSVKQVGPKEPAVSFLQLFRYITPLETALNCFSACAAVGNGIIFPCFTLLFGQMLGMNDLPLPYSIEPTKTKPLFISL